MSKFAIPNVDIPKLTDSEQKFQYLLNIVQDLQERVTSHDDVIAELTALRNENATLKAEITNLRAQLESSTSRTSTTNDSDSSSVFPPLMLTNRLLLRLYLHIVLLPLALHRNR